MAAWFPTPSNRHGPCPAQPGTPTKTGLQSLSPYNPGINSKIHRDLQPRRVISESMCFSLLSVGTGQLGEGTEAACLEKRK